MTAFRLPSTLHRLPALLALFLAPAAALAQETVSPLPPPMTRGIYRSRWFEYLSAHLEDDVRGASAALGELKRAAQTVGVRRLSDFSQAALYEGKQAEAQGRFDRAERAYDAALELDDGNGDAHFARIALLLRRGSIRDAAAGIPGAAASLLATRESRLSILSALAVWGGVGFAAATFGTILALAVRYLRLSAHAITESARRFFGRRAAVPLALILLVLPLAFGLGPLWLLLYLGALVFSGAARGERAVLGGALVALGLLPPLAAALSEENVIERSPIVVAALDLDESREDARAEDGLRQASSVFPDDPDIWFLLGIYAERSADRARALAAYDRSIREDPSGFQALLHRGNIEFQEGNVAQAVQDFESASARAPRSAAAFYNLALARADAYDFDGQAEALRRARAISSRDVAYWSSHPTMARVISLSYPLSRARAKVEQWNRQPRGARLPGHSPPGQVLRSAVSPFALGPWVALALGLVLLAARSRRGVPAECVQCGAPHCVYCRRYGDPPGYCASCARSRKEARGIDAQIRKAEQLKGVARWRSRVCRSLAVVVPGAHRFLSNRPASGFATLFLFGSLLAAAGLGSRAFGPRWIAPRGPWTGLSAAALAAAGLVWVASLWSAWRHPHES